MFFTMNQQRLDLSNTWVVTIQHLLTYIAVMALEVTRHHLELTSVTRELQGTVKELMMIDTFAKS